MARPTETLPPPKIVGRPLLQVQLLPCWRIVQPILHSLDVVRFRRRFAYGLCQTALHGVWHRQWRISRRGRLEIGTRDRAAWTSRIRPGDIVSSGAVRGDYIGPRFGNLSFGTT